MSWIARSEYRLTSLLSSAATVECPVRSVGVWHAVHPTWWKRCFPLLIEDAPPGSSVDGTRGARNRMNAANFSISLNASRPLLSGLVVSLGVGAFWHAGVSSRSV